MGRLRRERPARAHERADARQGQAGHRRGEGGQDVLPVDAARLSGRQRAEPAPASRRRSAPRSGATSPTGTTASEWDKPGFVDVINDDAVIMHLQYSTQWDTLAHVGALFDADGDGKAEAHLLQRLSRRHRPRGAERRPRRPGAVPGTMVEAKGTSSANALGVENMAVKCLQGRGVMIDLFAHFGRKRHAVGYDDLMRVMAADGIKVEAGRLRAAAHRLRRGDPGGQEEARCAHAGDELHRPRRRRCAPAAVDHRVQAGGADLRQLRGRADADLVQARATA